jgi:hypothetical protein
MESIVRGGVSYAVSAENFEGDRAKTFGHELQEGRSEGELSGGIPPVMK